jgi:hypothetical protein
MSRDWSPAEPAEAELGEQSAHIAARVSRAPRQPQGTERLRK